MERILNAVNTNLKPVEDINATVIIEGDQKIVYSTDNWDVSKDLIHINEVWGFEEKRELFISGEKYKILRNTNELLVAVAVEIGKRYKAIPKESIVGFKDTERKILIKLSKKSKLPVAVSIVARFISDISKKEPYIKSEIPLGKVENFDLTPKILSNTSRVLEKLGISRIGISEDEAKVYLALLRKSDRGEKIGNLDKELDLKRTHIYRIIDRLIDKNWVEQISKVPKGAQFYAARPIIEMLNKIIKEKEEEMKILQGFKLILGDNSKNGWKIGTLDSNSLKKPFDLNIQEIIGFEKDSGIVIFEYDRLIKDEENLDKVKLRLYSENLKQKIEEHEISDLEDIEIVETKIENYLGAELNIRFRENTENANNLGKDWINVVRLVAIPLDNRIYVIWGSERKFPYLLNIIRNLKY
ncbi:MAG: helix-turn-helix domain-containing protein [Promethearchaeota archaeon]